MREGTTLTAFYYIDANGAIFLQFYDRNPRFKQSCHSWTSYQKSKIGTYFSQKTYSLMLC